MRACPSSPKSRRCGASLRRRCCDRGSYCCGDRTYVGRFPRALRRDSKVRRSIRSIGVAMLLVRVTSGETLLMHLGMSGSFRVDARSRRRDRGLPTPSRSSRPRRLRAVEWLDRDLQRSAAIRRDGSDRGRAGRRSRSLTRWVSSPSTQHLTRPRSRACAGRRVALKVALLDQRIVAGLGNIYASEALHRRSLSPLRRASTIATVSGRPRAHAVRLTSAIKSVLLEAIARSERPYRAGRFARLRRESERCPARMRRHDPEDLAGWTLDVLLSALPALIASLTNP